VKGSVEYTVLKIDWKVKRKATQNRDRLAAQAARESLLTFERTIVWKFIDKHLRFLAELVVQEFIKEALASIGVNHDNSTRRPPGQDRLPQAVLEGRRGLCWQTFHTLANKSKEQSWSIKLCSPATAPRKYEGKTGRLTHAGLYHLKDSMWIGTLNELFATSDIPGLMASEVPKPRWEKKLFRQKATLLANFLDEELSNPQLARLWRESLGQLAARYIWAIPHFTGSEFGKVPPDPRESLEEKQQIEIRLPALNDNSYLESKRRDLELRKTSLTQDILNWLQREAKLKNDGDSEGDDHMDVQIDLTDEQDLVQIIQDVQDPAELDTRHQIIRRVQSVCCDALTLFVELQFKASYEGQDTKLRLEPTLAFDSEMGAYTIGLEGRNQASMIEHLKNLHPSLSLGDDGDGIVEKVLKRLIDLVKDMGPALGFVVPYSRDPTKPYKDTNKSTLWNLRCNDYIKAGLPAYAVFGDVLHLKNIDQYMDHVEERRQTQSRQRRGRGRGRGRGSEAEHGDEENSNILTSDDSQDGGIFVPQGRRKKIIPTNRQNLADIISIASTEPSDSGLTTITTTTTIRTTTTTEGEET
jgi:hypothetical protein